MPTYNDAPPAAGLTKALSILMIVLMVSAVGYAVWIALRNWNHIGV